ncbi:MAG: substrate-binding domain-containing protein [Desulfobacter sp.]|nr:substrate-binding domain-containing protein [Desulfobacter sp.]WDP85257.1 MAG: substrate-binding domain-containing protein [Desulfobacter sp.]
MKSYKLGILFGQRANSFWLKMKQAYETAAPKYSVDPIFAWPVPGREEKTQLVELFKLLDADLDAVIVNPLDRFNLIPGILEAAGKQIPIFDVGAKADAKAVRSAHPFYVPVKTVDFYQQGILGADYIIQRLTSMGGGKVAILEGSENSTQSIERCRGAVDRFARVSQISIAGRVAADFDMDKARKASADILCSHPDLAAIFCANDYMALGAAQTVDTWGGANPVIIVGVDLIDEARQAILAGKMAASVAFSVSEVATLLLRAAIQGIQGQMTPPAGYAIVSHLIDKHNKTLGE